MDWLGSARTQSAVSGGLRDDRSFAPYGEVYQTTNQDNPFLFAGTTSFLLYGTLYDTPNRELSAVAGRWNSPDPAHASWNACSYPTDPNRETDPTGLDGQSPSPCAGWGRCELANDHISPLMDRFFVPDSAKYGTETLPNTALTAGLPHGLCLCPTMMGRKSRSPKSNPNPTTCKG